MAWAEARAGAGDEMPQAWERLAGFRRELYRCLPARADALSELCDAALCKQDRVHMLAELSLEPAHQRGHGALYDALNCGKVQVSRLRWALAGVPLPAWDDGRIRLAVDVSNWLRPDAATSPGRSFCHCYGRGNNSAQMIPGWPYSLVAALEPGRTSWTRLLDAVRLGPDDDLAAVTAAQVRGVIEADHRRRALARRRPGHHGDLRRRLRAGPAGLAAGGPARAGAGAAGHQPGAAAGAAAPPARPDGPADAARLRAQALDDAACPGPDVHTTTQTSRYGTADARAWHRMHPKLKARGAWAGHQGELPVIEGTLVKLTVEHLPHDRAPKPVWLWTSCPDADPDQVNRCWQAFLRRFDIEHTFRFLKQVLGWTKPKLRDPAAADRWTWLILACYAQLWLARGLAADLRLPWQRPALPGRLTPARVRRGFRAIHGTLPVLTAAPKPGKPGPGRPPGSKNRHPATRHDVGKAAIKKTTQETTPNPGG